jgi:DNA-directed RNA polymerase beta' subunit
MKLKVYSGLTRNGKEPPFDGDEMNLHMPQDPEAESELKNLAAVPYQIISPGNNAPIIGIYQDSMLGSYRFTRENISFSHKEAMNLLMMFDRVNPAALIGGKSVNDRISNFEVMSQILPPLSIKVKNKQFDGETENIAESNNVVEIKDGHYLRGQMDKGILGSGTKGLIHRVCNSFGNMASAKFIDDLQNIVTEYMKQSSFSVGISDLITSATTNAKIISIITDKKTDVKKLIDQVQVGIFENNSGKTNEEEFETKINNILGKAQSEAGREALKNLSKDNRFVIMFNAGSKGTEINIQQMTACLGQQNVDGKRIPYGFEHRTLPHYTKYDDSPVARGFVESSYINGLSPQEVFFHAMGGRIGLIDTAVKSVVSNTPIIIIENGEPRYVEIGKWIDNQLDNCATPTDIQHFTERRMELLNTANIYIPTTDENGIVTWGEVTAVTRHDPGTALYEIKTSGGRSVIVTESKSLLIWNPETKKLVETLTPEIIVGDCVPVTAELCEPPIIKESIDMSVYLSKTKYIYGTEFNTAIQMMEHAMEERSKIPDGWWEENNGLNFVLPYVKKASLQRTLVRSNTDNIKSGFIYPYHAARKGMCISDHFELNEENGIFIGLFLAEGNAFRNTVTITNLDDNIIAFMKNWFEKKNICSTERRRVNKIGGTTRTITGNSSILATFITKLVGSGAANKYVPTEAFIAPRSFVKGLLNGYYSGDGTIGKNSVEVGSASSRLIEGISMLCSRFGIFGKVFKTQLKSNNLGTKNIKPTYRLSIRAQWGQKFAETVSLIDDKKMKKMSGIKWNTNHRNFETYNDIVLDKIVEINIVGVEKYPKVYDLTIPSTLNFGLANGLQVRDTSTTGYIQRRLIKGMEDLMVNYDMTVRSSKGKVVQFSYGDDGIDTIKVENQEIPIVEMTMQDIYAHFNVPEDNKGKSKALSGMFVKSALTRQKKQEEELNEKCKKYTDYMIENRSKIIKNIFNYKSDKVVRLPVAFMHIIQNVMGQQNVNPNSLVDITMLEAFDLIEETFDNLLKIRYAKPTELFRVMYFYYLSPKDLLLNKRFNKKALDILMQTIVLDYKRSIVAPGEMVGMIAAQSIGEPTTQMSQPFCEHIRCAKINKNTKMISMVSGPIGELCDGLIEANAEYTFNTGHADSVETLLDALEDEYYIIGVDGQEKTHWNKISHVSRHPVNGNLMKATTKSGRIVTTTLSHSHLVRDNQTVVPITGADLKEGMRIPVAKHIDNDFVNEFVTIDNKEYKLDYLFGWFVGAYLAEGNVTKYSTCITNISEHFIEQTKQFAARFDKTCNVNKRQGEYGPSTQTTFSCKLLAEFLLSTCGTGSFVKIVPDFAFLAPLEFKAGLIQAYMDGDGNFQSDEKHHQIRVCSRSKQLSKDMALLFNYFDIFASIKENFVRGSPIYNLSISAKYSGLYQDKIGSLVHTDKLMNLVKYCERTDALNLSDEIDKISGLGEIIAKCGKVLKLPGYGFRAKKDSIGRRTLEKYIEVFETSENVGLISEELRILKQAASSGVIWDEIVNIEIIVPDQSEYVYDFTVPANQTFMTDYGVIVHNTLNSVTYETEIIVRDREGRIKKTQIGDFIENKIKVATKTEYYKDKDTTYSEVDDYYEIPSCTEDGEMLWKRIEAVTKHPVINTDGTNVMLKITTKEQREVIVTKAKSVLKLMNGKITQINGDELRVGDYLPVSKMQVDFAETNVLDLKTILSPTEYIYSSEIEKAKAVMTEHHWWSKHRGTTFILPYSRSDSFIAKVSEKLRSGCKTKTTFAPGCVYMLQSNFNDYQIPEHLPLDYNLGYLVGAYAAEGCMNRFQVSISNNVDSYFAPILEFCEKHNLTTKIYKVEDKNQKGWTSQDIRIYSTVLCRLLEHFCGKLSHNKFVSNEIIFSNKECLLGFMDAYIGGDGCVNTNSKQIGHSPDISMASVSKELLMDVQQILNILGVYSKISKFKKQETNNRGSKDIKQIYYLYVRNKQSQKLASMLNIKMDYKQENLKKILAHDFKYEYCHSDTMVPNEIDGQIVMIPRDKMTNCFDTYFDKVVSIEEVSNTTNYAYDLTISDTRNFNIYNGLALVDTFHFAGVASKSNVTRGVPRIEEILSLSASLKNPSLTVYLKPEEETDRDKASTIQYMLEHTRLEEIVKSIEICFDPDDLNTLIDEDKNTMAQYREFETMVAECLNSPVEEEQGEKSKWIIRIIMDPEVMLEKNITMDDVNFTLNNTYKDEISCVYSDYNADKLVFRIRMKNIIDNAKSRSQKKAKLNPLDQSDQIYILKNFQDTLLNNIVLRGVKNINKVILRKIKDNLVEKAGAYIKKDIWVLDTIGTNMLDVLGLDYIDPNRTFSNDIIEIYHVLGMEAARFALYNELAEVLEFDGAYVNAHHMALLCDRMTFNYKMVSIFRHGINNDDIGPIAKASFEETPEMFLKAARHAELDTMRGISANVMCGQEGLYGTASFQVVLDINEMINLDEKYKYEYKSNEDIIEETLFAGLSEKEEVCSKRQLEIDTNVSNIKMEEMGNDNDYDPFA